MKSNENKDLNFDKKSSFIQPTSPSMIKVLIAMSISAVVAFCSVMFFPTFLVLFGMAFDSAGTKSSQYSLMQMGYLRNKFVVYGRDEKSWSNQSKPVIFSSTDGKAWDKNSIGMAPVGYTDESSRQSTYGVFIEFNQQCYLIGAVALILVSKSCDNNWEYIIPNGLLTKNQGSLFDARGAIIDTIHNQLYVSGNGGIYSSKDGNNWQQESLPYPVESNPKNFENFYNGIAFGDNRIITSSKWRHDGKTEGLIYTYDVIKKRWSYQVMPEPIVRITRGGDRFVGIAKNTTFVLEDKLGIWKQSSILEGEPLDLLFDAVIAMNGSSYIMFGSEGLRLSSNGYKWHYVKAKSYHDGILRFSMRSECSHGKCLRVFGTTNGISIDSYSFLSNIYQSYDGVIY